MSHAEVQGYLQMANQLVMLDKGLVALARRIEWTKASC